MVADYHLPGHYLTSMSEAFLNSAFNLSFRQHFADTSPKVHKRLIYSLFPTSFHASEGDARPRSGRNSRLFVLQKAAFVDIALAGLWRPRLRDTD
jgi:hypothetical protein